MIQPQQSSICNSVILKFLTYSSRKLRNGLGPFIRGTMPVNRVRELQRRMGDISAQSEAAEIEVRPTLHPLNAHDSVGNGQSGVSSILQARQLIAWKQRQRPRGLAELVDEDRNSLALSRRQRLADIIQRACAPLLKHVIGHKV